MGMGRTIPAMPVRDMAAAVACYRDKFGFAVVHRDGGFAVLQRDDARVHLWEASDTSWRQRDLAARPVQSGAEDFISGTASFRVEMDSVEDVDTLYAELAPRGVLHYTDRGAPVRTDFGTHEFSAVDVDGNLVGFFRWVDQAVNGVGA